jgi:hypothetical protein
MSLEPESELREVSGIDEDQRIAIRNFMQGAIYCWVKNRMDEPFAVRDLVGGENTDWSRTPLQGLYEKHIGLNKEEDAAFEDAAKDLGWLVKSLLANDRRRFSVRKSGLVNSYNWIRD